MLLEELNIVTDTRFLWAGAFATVGAVFTAIFVLRHEAWWAAIPAGALLGLGVVTGIGDSTGTVAGVVTGGAFLGLSGAGFWAVYLSEHERWWAIIPGGVLVTLGGVSALEVLTSNEMLQGGALFLGLGATFLLLAVVPTGAARQRWAFIPGGILAMMGLPVTADAGAVLELLGYLWPVALIAVGLYLLWRATRGHAPRSR